VLTASCGFFLPPPPSELFADRGSLLPFLRTATLPPPFPTGYGVFPVAGFALLSLCLRRPLVVSFQALSRYVFLLRLMQSKSHS